MLKNKTVILFIIGLVMMAGGCKKQPAAIVIIPDVQKNHLQHNHISGIVKNMETATYILSDDSLTIQDTLTAIDVINERTPDAGAFQHYTSDGYLLNFVKLNKEKDTVLRRAYHYDNQAKPTTWEEYDYQGQMTANGKYVYDHNNYISGEQIFADDSLVIDFHHTTDGVGNIIESIQSYGDYSTRTETKYNEQGLMTKVIEYEPDGKVFKTVEIEYDNYGDEVNRRVFKAGNVLLEYTYHVYEQDGRLQKKIYEDKIHRYKEIYLYSDFDAYKNWQTEIRMKDNRIMTIRKRNITYY